MMIVPNKIYKFEDTVISKLPLILKQISSSDIGINELFIKLEDQFEDIIEYIFAVEVLYLLDIIDVDFSERNISYVSRDKK